MTDLLTWWADLTEREPQWTMDCFVLALDEHISARQTFAEALKDITHGQFTAAEQLFLLWAHSYASRLLAQSEPDSWLHTLYEHGYDILFIDDQGHGPRIHRHLRSWNDEQLLPLTPFEFQSGFKCERWLKDALYSRGSDKWKQTGGQNHLATVGTEQSQAMVDHQDRKPYTIISAQIRMALLTRLCSHLLAQFQGLRWWVPNTGRNAAQHLNPSQSYYSAYRLMAWHAENPSPASGESLFRQEVTNAFTHKDERIQYTTQLQQLGRDANDLDFACIWSRVDAHFKERDRLLQDSWRINKTCVNTIAKMRNYEDGRRSSLQALQTALGPKARWGAGAGGWILRGIGAQQLYEYHLTTQEWIHLLSILNEAAEKIHHAIADSYQDFDQALNDDAQIQNLYLETVTLLIDNYDKNIASLMV